MSLVYEASLLTMSQTQAAELTSNLPLSSIRAKTMAQRLQVRLVKFCRIPYTSLMTVLNRLTLGESTLSLSVYDQRNRDDRTAFRVGTALKRSELQFFQTSLGCMTVWDDVLFHMVARLLTWLKASSTAPSWTCGISSHTWRAMSPIRL